MIDMKSPKRIDGESFDAYRARLRMEQASVKKYMRGKLIWNSFANGTRTREKAE